MRHHNGPGVFGWQLPSPYLARPDFRGMGFNPQPEPPTRFIPPSIRQRSWYGGYGVDDPTTQPPPAQQQQALPPMYIAYGALGLAGLALIVAIARS